MLQLSNPPCPGRRRSTTTILSWFCFWFSTNWLGPVCRIPVCRILELKKNDKTINVGMMKSIKRASDVPTSSSAPRPLGASYIPILLSEVEQEQRPSGNGDREAIVEQRPAPTTIASRSSFPLGLCSCSTSLSKMGI